MESLRKLLILLPLLCISSNAAAQQTEETARVHEFTRVDSFACPGQGTIAGSSIFLLIDDKTVNTFGSFFPAGSPERTLFSTFPTELALMRNGGALLDQVIGQWRATGRSFSAWANPAPGRIAVERIFVPQICSHNFAARVQQFGGQSVANILGQANSPFRSDGVRFYVLSPETVQFQSQAKKYPVCPTGTQPLYLGTTGPKHRSFSNWVEAQQFSTSPGWSLWNVWEDVFPGEGVTCIPAEVKAAWTVHAEALNAVIGADNRFSGDFVGKITLGINGAPNTLQALNIQRPNRQAWFDQSRNTFYTPGNNSRVIHFAKSALQANVINTNPLGRLGVYVHERTGRAYSLIAWDAFVNGAADAITVTEYGVLSSFTNKYLVHPEATSEQVQTANCAGQLEGDILFRAICEEGYSKGRIRMYDLRLGQYGAEIANFIIPHSISTSGAWSASRPRLGLDAKRNELLILNVQIGKLYALHLATGAVRAISIANQNGDAIRDMAVDATLGLVYLLANPTFGNTGNTNDQLPTIGRILVQTTDGTAVAQMPSEGILPWAITIGNVGGRMTAFVVNGNTIGMVQEIDLATFTTTRLTPIGIQPVALALEYVD